MQRILVIDDDESLRDTIGVMLERENFVPLFAENGKQGLDKAILLKPNLLLVDLRLPKWVAPTYAVAYGPTISQRPSLS